MCCGGKVRQHQSASSEETITLDEVAGVSSTSWPRCARTSLGL